MLLNFSIYVALHLAEFSIQIFECRLFVLNIQDNMSFGFHFIGLY
jgi:hypothetical protein